jgi:hypothetical protein
MSLPEAPTAPTQRGRAGRLRRAGRTSSVLVAGCLALSSCDPAAPSGGPPNEPLTEPPAVRVAVSGRVDGDGSADRPFQTIQRAVDVAASGTTVLVGSGDYTGFHVIRDAITVGAAPGARSGCTTTPRM